MQVGILSDSHGQHLMVRQAMALFDRLGVGHVLHCGDVGGSDVFDELVGRSVTFVWGNTDCPSNGLMAYLQTVGLSPPGEAPARVTLGGKQFAIFHGHESGFDEAIRCLDVDYLLHGHSHLARDDRRGSTRIINPGALYRARPTTVATLDTSNDRLRFHEVSANGSRSIGTT